MIYGLVQTIQEDASVFVHWMKNDDISQEDGDAQQQRVHLAALRMLASLGMAFGALWTLSLLTFVITVPLTIAWKLSVAVGIYVANHDVFIMCQNASQEDFKQNEGAGLLDLFRGQEKLEEEQADQFTHGTFMQPLWMWAYAPHNHTS